MNTCLSVIFMWISLPGKRLIMVTLICLYLVNISIYIILNTLEGCYDPEPSRKLSFLEFLSRVSPLLSYKAFIFVITFNLMTTNIS